MREFREQAIKDVMAVAQNRPGHMTTLDAYRSYAVAQREARLRERAALREIKLHSSSKSSTHKIARAALDAGKEG